MTRSFRVVALTVAAFAILLAGNVAFVRPSNHRAWQPDVAVLPRAEFAGSQVVIHDLRNFAYAADGAAQPAYEDRRYDLDRIETLWFVLSPFEKDQRGPAHSFLSFGFADSQYVAISVEARRERDEPYSILKGMLRRFELIYVIGDERDLIGVRANNRGDDVYLYPIRASRPQIRQLFVEMLERANQLHERPEFYNTLTNNCTTRILEHANRVATKKIPYGREVLLPGYADELAVQLGLIESNGDINEVRSRFLVNERARRFATAPDFSVRIRDAMGTP
ncbi:MAG TPA: DUF4105 domain-containing protein [Longimicrobiales bacterium]|nr:DUF4105 domain-containing protein [Longimicrobiales bacterium]